MKSEMPGNIYFDEIPSVIKDTLVITEKPDVKQQPMKNRYQENNTILQFVMFLKSPALLCFANLSDNSSDTL